MQFPYIDISFIYSEIRALLKNMNVQGLINDEDLRAWAFTAVRLIGCTNYEDASEDIEIKNFKAFIPNDFYTIKSIKYVGEDPINARVQKTMNAGDSNTKALFQVDLNNGLLIKGDYEFVIKNPPGLIRTNFRSGWVEFQYNRLPKTKNGDLLAQDEQNNIEAIKYYIMTQLTFEKMLMNEIPRPTWDLLDQKYQEFKRMAACNLKFPDPSRIDEFVRDKDNRYTRFNLR